MSLSEEMYIVEDVWREIKTFLFHDILSQGKHLKDDAFVRQFNNVVLEIPRLDKIHFPQFFCNPAAESFRTMTCVYALKGSADPLTSSPRSKHLLVTECRSLDVNASDNVLFHTFNEGITFVPQA